MIEESIKKFSIPYNLITTYKVIVTLLYNYYSYKCNFYFPFDMIIHACRRRLGIDMKRGTFDKIFFPPPPAPPSLPPTVSLYCSARAIGNWPHRVCNVAIRRRALSSNTNEQEDNGRT